MSTFAIHGIKLAGFRAYLNPKSFDFSSKKSLAIFAPNGHGKSSLVDAFEFMFSEQGTLQRLGLRAGNNTAGPTALANYQATEKMIEPEVKLSVKCGNSMVECTKKASGSDRPSPPELGPLLQSFTVSPIIRGHELRSFVDSQSPEERYRDVVSWFDLNPLLQVQRNLKDLRRKIKASCENQQPIKDFNQRLSAITENNVKFWDEQSVVAFANEKLATLDDELIIKELNSSDAAISKAIERAKKEEEKLGIEGLRQIQRIASSIYLDQSGDSGGAETGYLATFEQALASREEASKTEVAEREKAEKACFAELWGIAEPFFANENQSIDNCPICTTPLGSTSKGSRSAIHKYLTDSLGELAEYAQAKKCVEDASRAASESMATLAATLETLVGLLGDNQAERKSTLINFKNGLATDNMKDAVTVKAVITELIESVASQIEGVTGEQDTPTYSKVNSLLSTLFSMRDEILNFTRTQAELTNLNDQLGQQSSFISGAIRNKVQTLLDSLRVPVNRIYKSIQGDQAAEIKLELPNDEEAAVHHRLALLIDFAGNGGGVQPGSYLSDSQIHSLALSIRLAAIKLFNDESPLIILDDVVTSYDADHRRNIAALLANEFSTFQLIVTTHDERFFVYLKDQLSEQDWHFTRIIRLDKGSGPFFGDHRVSEAMIASIWKQGNSAANEIRQAEEEWLLQICREFGVDVRIRPLERPYSYERSELAAALSDFLIKKQFFVPTVEGVNNRFLISLQQGAVENFGSHFQDNPHGSNSIGDEKARWKEFSDFRSKFACPSCGKRRFKRPGGVSKPICASSSCETPFSFSTAT